MANTIPMQMYISNGDIVSEFAVDQKKKKEEILQLLSNVLGNSFTGFNFRQKQKVATGFYTTSGGKKIYIMVANITFMGGKEGQHPKDLKRIQYNVTWREFYEEYSNQGEVLWMGLYSYKGTNVWGIFHPETYLKKHEGKSMVTKKKGIKAVYSCHIYLNDLFQGHVNNVFNKTDKGKNHIEGINLYYLKSRFEQDDKTKNPIIETIKDFNEKQVDWNKWITAESAITYMKNLREKNGFNQWKQNLWNGWFIEAKYSEYLTQNPSPYIDYIATSNNQAVLDEYKGLGLDLSFQNPAYHFIGDLKAVCEGTGNTLLNDEQKVLNALEKYKRIWFVIYFHDKKQGKTNNYEMVKWRNHFILDEKEWDWNKKKVFDELDAENTPYSVSYTQMVIIELNSITKDKYFTVGKQFGLNSDGKERHEKFKVDKKLLKALDDDSFVIYRYCPNAV